MTHDELIDDAAQFRGDMTDDERYKLMERVARNEPMRFVEIPANSKLRRPTHSYRMLYPHPLPVDSSCGESPRAVPDRSSVRTRNSPKFR